MKTETKIKLSPKQKEVIRLMREGSYIRKATDFATISALRHSSIIYCEVTQLTELGKTINID